jgi:uncharacterized damage-inducible protein DinB
VAFHSGTILKEQQKASLQKVLLYIKLQGFCKTSNLFFYPFIFLAGAILDILVLIPCRSQYMAMNTNLPEVWLRGPVENIPSLLQPAAHAVMQALEEVKAIMQDFPHELLWARPAGVASVAFHLQHMSGVLDRLSTYARKEMLSPDQMNWLQGEGKEITITADALLDHLEQNVQLYLQQLAHTSESSLIEPRTIGRKALPTTHLGLLFHAAEHTQRHLGQLLVTARVVKANYNNR